MRAAVKYTSFGQKVRQTSWLMHEYTVLKALHQDGDAVPRPWAVDDIVILMDTSATKT
jgi:serine/threonine-protein kinase RIO1